MFEKQILLLMGAGFAASLPVIIWLYILFTKTNQSKKVIVLIFGLGCLTAPALILLQVVWNKFPQFNLAAFIENTVKDNNRMWLFTYMLFGAMEEIIKHYVISSVDKKTLYLKTINDTIRYSLAAALGFAFTENIYYFYIHLSTISVAELTGMYIFRSTFTACAHMIFSGIFGYYYAIGKFSIYIAEQQKLSGSISGATKLIGKIFNLPLNQAYQQKMVLKGLLISIGLHVGYNYMLHYNVRLPVILFVVLGFIYMGYLLKRKAGHLILTDDISEKRRSTLAKKDEEVILELMGMWFKEKKYVDVIHICERLLERDPDNTVVKYFKAKAMDQIDNSSVYKKILSTVIKTDEDLNDYSRNKLSKYLNEKETFKKVQDMIKKRLEKEGKTFQQAIGSPQPINLKNNQTKEKYFKISE